jgi:hypothetical protein
VATAAVVVVVGSGLPAPGQVEPLGPEISYIDAYGPAVYGYEDCDGVVHTEEDEVGFIYVELEDDAEADVAVTISFSGSLADDLVDPPTTIDVVAGTFWGEAPFALDELETGDLTVTVEPGLDYTSDPEDTYTFEISDEVEVLASCRDDLGTPPDGTDRQTIDVGGRPAPIGFFDDVEEIPGEEGTTTTTTEVVETTESTTTSSTTTTTEAIDPSFAQVRAVRAAPEGYDTPVVGDLPPGLTYEDDVWGGAATTPGLYAFDIRVCFDQGAFTIDAGRKGGARRPTPRAFPDVICVGSVDVQVLVEGAAQEPAPPVRAAARFAG